MADLRIGHGYDVHKLVSGRKLILCGVNIPYEYGLLGHSDADAALHAAMDAVLGALGMGDIGRFFPDSDPAFEGISSLILAEKTAQIMKKAGFEIGNLDITIVCQRPKLAKYNEEMKKNVAAAFGCAESDVNIKATTEEGLGFTGTGEGISAHAVVLLEKIR